MIESPLIIPDLVEELLNRNKQRLGQVEQKLDLLDHKVHQLTADTKNLGNNTANPDKKSTEKKKPQKTSVLKRIELKGMRLFIVSIGIGMITSWLTWFITGILYP